MIAARMPTTSLAGIDWLPNQPPANCTSTPRVSYGLREVLDLVRVSAGWSLSPFAVVIGATAIVRSGEKTQRLARRSRPSSCATSSGTR